MHHRFWGGPLFCSAACLGSARAATQVQNDVGRHDLTSEPGCREVRLWREQRHLAGRESHSGWLGRQAWQGDLPDPRHRGRLLLPGAPRLHDQSHRLRDVLSGNGGAGRGTPSSTSAMRCRWPQTSPPRAQAADATGTLRPQTPPAPARVRPRAPHRWSWRSGSSWPRAPPAAHRPCRRGCAPAESHP